MAERRMFAKTIVLSDAFLDMPLSARCLYFTLGMVADDDGFVNAPKSIMRQCGATEDDMRLLLAKRFLLCFESGVIVIKHWRINNYLQKDRIQPTKYLEEKASLTIEPNGSYSREDAMYTETVYTQNRIDKDRLDKNRLGEVRKGDYKGKTKFSPPTPEEVRAYCKEKGYTWDPEAFLDFYASKGWKVGSQPMKDWKAACRNWERGEKERRQRTRSGRDALAVRPDEPTRPEEELPI